MRLPIVIVIALLMAATATVSGAPVKGTAVCQPLGGGAEELAGRSKRPERVAVFVFQPDSNDYQDFACILQSYDSGGLNVDIAWALDAQGEGDVVWRIGIRRMVGGSLSNSHGWDFNSRTVAPVPGVPRISQVTFADGPDMDSWGDREIAIVRVTRGGLAKADTASAPAYLWVMSIWE